MLCTGDYNHALELDTRKQDVHLHSSRRFNSAQNSPIGAGRKAVGTGSEQDLTQLGYNIHTSQSSQDDLIKATHGQKDGTRTPSDSFMRASRCGSLESHGSQPAPDRGCETEAAIEVVKPGNGAQSTDVTSDTCSRKGHVQSRSATSKDEQKAQLIAQHLASGYSNRKQVFSHACVFYKCDALAPTRWLNVHCVTHS